MHAAMYMFANITQSIYKYLKLKDYTIRLLFCLILCYCQLYNTFCYSFFYNSMVLKNVHHSQGGNVFDMSAYGDNHRGSKLPPTIYIHSIS